jgi:hypothetical protein
MEKKKMNVLYRRDERFPITEITRMNAVRNPPCVIVIAVYGEDERHFCMFREKWTIKVLGDRIFWKKLESQSLTFKGGRFYGHLDSLFMRILCEVFHIDWISQWCFSLIGSNKTLFKAILQGKITNPEDLCKKYSKLYFKGAYSYKNLKECALKVMSFSLWTLYYYCTNPNEGLRYLLDLRAKDEFNASFRWFEDYSTIQESDIRDFLYYCEILGDTKWNPKWSKNRLITEHQKQIERVQLLEIQGKSNELIAPSFSKDGLSLITDERTCYEEGLYMHNCVHTCYWHRIQDGIYLIAKGDVKGDHINLGITIDETPRLDQVHTIRNGEVSDDVREFCINWIEANKEALNDTVKYIKVVHGV